jgi:hypothetical protein
METRKYNPARVKAGGIPRRMPAYLENFLYLIRCGTIESVPKRRILSFS